MAKETFIVAICFILAFILFIFALGGSKADNSIPKQIKICTWNLDNFELNKIYNMQTLEAIKDRIKSCDVFFVSDIRDESGKSFEILCSMTGYNCYNSSINGDLIKQQYGVFWNKKINNTIIDYSSYINVTYPPIFIRFYLFNYTLDVYYFRTNKQNIDDELNTFHSFIPNTGYTLLMGDFHNDCIFSEYKFNDYYSVANNTCNYERIYVNQNMLNYINDSGTDTNFSSDISINYISWIKINT